MSRFIRFLRFRFFALLLLLPLITGCLVIEKKTLVLMIPEKSEEIQLYYLFEGLSVLRDSEATTEKAIKDLRGLEENRLNFFVGGMDPHSPLLKITHFTDLNYYLDPTRERKLCADRRATITNRNQFIKELNQLISVALKAETETPFRIDPPHPPLRMKLRELEQLKESHDTLGLGAIAKTYNQMLLLVNQLDEDSLDKFLLAARKTTDWIRLENGTIRILLPATRECAQKICSGEFAEKWTKEMESFVSPLELNSTKEGIEIVVGKKGQPIQLTFTDTREYQKDLDAKLIDSIGPVNPIKIDGKPANGKKLIERFVERTKKAQK
jgi:hypothetical protein